MNIKKKISLVLALLMSVSMLATGCKKTDEDTPGLTEAATTVSSSAAEEVTEETEAATITQMTTSKAEESETTVVTEESEVSETEESEVPETEESETESSAAEESVSETSVTTTAATTVTTTVTTTAATTARDWNETEINEVMYTSNACYSRAVPKQGADVVKQYKKGVKVKVIAHTDTGYYKLEDGAFIYADYLTDTDPAAVTTTTAAEEFEEEVIYDDDYTEDQGSSENTGSTSGSSSSSAAVSGSQSYKNRYGYKTLNAAQQEFYGNIVQAAYNLDSKVKVPDGLLSDDIMKVYGMVFNQEPQLFWLSRTVPSGYGSVRMSYTVSSIEERDAMQKEIDKNANAVLAAANQYTSTFSKLKVFYDWIITNAEFSVSSEADTCAIYNGMTGGKELQCVGYAKTMMYLCDLAGIECMTITGRNTEGSSHAWNVVYCDNGYYNLDTAWGDPINSHNSKYVRYSFFLVPDAWIKNEHLNVNQVFKSNGTAIKYFDPPACTKTSCNYFKAYNKEYSDAESAAQGMYEELAAAVSAGKNVAHIRVTDYDTWETLFSSSYAKAFNSYAKKLGNVKGLSPQKTYNDGVLVVQYDIFYK
ncbi:MAG: hypothetical protein IJ007_08070 [Oscillospiraceae bacterium]|nr:hypothetical protein [Oscillospiraceae bacterium]